MQDGDGKNNVNFTHHKFVTCKCKIFGEKVHTPIKAHKCKAKVITQSLTS